MDVLPCDHILQHLWPELSVLQYVVICIAQLHYVLIFNNTILEESSSGFVTHYSIVAASNDHKEWRGDLVSDFLLKML